MAGTFLGGSNIGYLKAEIDKKYMKLTDAYKKSETYSKSEVDNKVNSIDTSTYATKTELNNKTGQATSSKAGIAKLYNGVGVQTDGGVTPKALKDVADAAASDDDAIRSDLTTKVNELTTKINEKTTASAALAEAQKNANRRLPAGTIVWFAGKTAQKPKNTLVCDGSAISRTTYADLFAAIGTIYGAGNGSTTFNIPDLMDAGDSANLGRFIRAATSDADVGKKEADAIRNIIGNIHWWKVLTRKSEGIYGEGGALRYVKGTGKYTPGQENTSESTGFDFDASRVVPTSNENRPYDIALLPLVAY